MEQTAIDNNDSLLERMLLRSDALHERLDELLGDAEFDGTARGMCLVAMEHATALRALMALGMPISAVSLMRLQFEALTRAMWLIYAASESAIEKLSAPRHDAMVLEDLIDAVQPVGGLQGRPKRRPDKLHADKGYDYARCREALRRRGIQARIARRGSDSSERLGRHRWGVERTHAWFAGLGKRRIRFERQLDTHLALLKLACAVIRLRFVERFC